MSCQLYWRNVHIIDAGRCGSALSLEESTRTGRVCGALNAYHVRRGCGDALDVLPLSGAFSYVPAPSHSNLA